MEKVSAGGQGVFLPAWKKSGPVYPQVSFETVLRIYRSDPAAGAGVDFMADQTVGMGFYISTKVPRAKAVLDDFCEAVNFDVMLQQTARETIASGNSFWEKIEPKRLTDLKVLPLTSIGRLQRAADGSVQWYEQTHTYGGAHLDPERIVHFRMNPVDSEALGLGLITRLATSLRIGGSERQGFAGLKASTEAAMAKIFKKYAGPAELWKFPKANDARIRELQSEVRGLPEEGARFVTNVPDAGVDVVQTDPRGRFDSYVDFLWNQYVLGLETPLTKLLTTPGFTEASARAAVEVAERKILSMQRFFKRVIEREIFTPVLEQSGLSPWNAEARLNWGMPERPEIKVTDILTGVEKGVVDRDEARAMLKEAGWKIELPPEGTTPV